ncbi:DUF4238 domain-containing protein [Rhizobium leguminosarum]|uniref:DUF4238 domain-containing protein n=1 Tax=Rhizobium leguminosarum TaxID=384 RepID=UPI001441B86A|nr:DUF4238 domain-containing protein [Rhizobium leguminosarum]MBY5818474.1 DUF4238 domain-containing protein [Rhizobium leguminosarum]NKK97200.1 DUF4238 domain-containing protein [Rhizobium leguminosarum bv. viciae]NKL75723.1 DUF4238 domain-containing protein [Rhizobium leguminosarum bv. viciae]
MENLPKYHHYLPSFYQSRWASDDGRLRRFSRPRDQIVAKWVFPTQSGGENNLYSDPEAIPDKAQVLESEFMSPLDSLASQALAMIETGDTKINRDPKFRSAWSRFLMSLMMRMPDDIDTLKISLVEEWARAIPELELVYAADRQDDWPPTFQEYLAQSPNRFSSWASSLLRTLIDHQNIGALLNNMRWFIREISGDAQFLTSDRPLITWYDFAEPDTYIFVPIGPKRAFVAVNNLETQRRIEAQPAEEWVLNLNKLVAGAAKKFVFATDDQPRKLVEQHFGSRPRTTLFQYLLRHRRKVGR